MFLASIYPIVLDQYTCPDFLLIETCEMSTYHALIVDIITTSIFTGVLAFFIYYKTKNTTRDVIRIEMGNLADRIRIDSASIGRPA